MARGHLPSTGSPRPPNSPHLPGWAAAAKELIATIGFQPSNAHAGRQFEPLQHLPGPGVDPSHIAGIVLPRAVPELPIDPGDTGDPAVRLDSAQHLPCPRIDLHDP